MAKLENIYIYIIKYIFITGYTLVILPVALVNFKENYFYTKKKMRFVFLLRFFDQKKEHL